MNNDTTGINEQPESKTQESPMPSDEQKIDQPSEVDTTSQETEEVGSTESGEDTLPDNTSDRTRDQFDKLRNQLREERSRREYLEGVYQSMQTQKQEQVPEQPIYDPETGLLNEQALTDIQKRALAAEQRAERAEQSVKQYQYDQENKETFKEYPELDPSNTKTFNKKMHVATRQILLDSMVNPQDYKNKQLSFREAAAIAKTQLPGAIENAKKEGAKEAMEQLSPKEQASLDAVGSPSRRNEALGNLDDLRKRTRRGDSQATIERMKRIMAQG